MGFLAALQFLTIIPVKCSFNAKQIGAATGYFPLVGLVIGGILVGLNYLFSLALPPALACLLLVAAMVAVSGGLHLDGLVDTCDGLAVPGTPRKRWQVMRDSRAGGFGVIGAALLLLAKFVSLDSLPQSWMAFSLLLTPVISRWTMVYAIFAYPYARPKGLGKAFKRETNWPQFLTATLITLAVSMGLFRLAGLVIFFLIWLISSGMAYYLKQKLDGLTGDTYGTINEIAEVNTLIIINLLSYQHWLGLEGG